MSEREIVILVVAIAHVVGVLGYFYNGLHAETFRRAAMFSVLWAVGILLLLIALGGEQPLAFVPCVWVHDNGTIVYWAADIASSQFEWLAVCFAGYLIFAIMVTVVGYNWRRDEDGGFADGGGDFGDC
ncbi:MAG: hypothetical protein GKS02_03105 [Alphaproteobacteria bacterium]|nr:hypothetical protein [Alphaproteobacteria bacterium]